MKKLWPILKHYFIHIFALILCISATFYTMIQLASDPLFKVYAGAGAIFAGLFAQYLRGLAAAYRRREKKWDGWRAGGLWAIVIFYIFVFEFISAFGVIVSLVAMEEQVYQQVSDNRTNLDDDLDDIKNDIRAKKEQRNEEFKNKGRGPKYDQFQDEIDDLEGQRREIEANLKTVSKTSKSVSKSVFMDLQVTTGILAKWFKISMSLALLLLIFMAPLMFPWKVPLEGLDWNKVKSTSPDNVSLGEALFDDSLTKIKELLEFTQALFNDTKKLNSVKMVSGKTGISLERCEVYWSHLMNLTIGDIPVIDKRQGGCVCNFTKDDLIQHLKSNYSQDFLDTLTGIG